MNINETNKVNEILNFLVPAEDYAKRILAISNHFENREFWDTIRAQLNDMNKSIKERYKEHIHYMNKP